MPDRAAGAASARVEEVLDEQRDVVARARAAAAAAMLHDVEAVVEVLAEAAARRPRLEVAVRRGDDAHVDLRRLASPPTRRTSRCSWSTRRSFGCSSSGSSPISSRKSVPPSARSKRPSRVAIGAGEGAAARGRRARSRRASRRSRAQSRTTKRPSRARRRVVDRARRRAPCRCRSRPAMSTVRSVGATRSRMPKTSRMRGRAADQPLEAVGIAGSESRISSRGCRRVGLADRKRRVRARGRPRGRGPCRRRCRWCCRDRGGSCRRGRARSPRACARRSNP